MILSTYKELDETKKRYLTLGRIGVILGLHVVVLGGGYFVTQYGGQGGNKADDQKMSYAGANGLVTWNSQDPNANEATVDGTSESLFDKRAEDISGYNAGDPKRSLYAAQTTSQSDTSNSGRYAPRRPTSSTSSSQSASTTSTQQRDDTVLSPVGIRSTESPARPDSASNSTFDYKVQSGDSLYGLSKRFNVSIGSIVSSNPGMKANSIRVGETLNIPRAGGTSQSSSAGASVESSKPKAAATSGSVYVVKSGDSLSRIASRQGVTVSELRIANGLRDDLIRIGQELRIPNSNRKPNLVTQQHTGSKYVVVPGDTLDKIAAVYRVTINELKVLNDIRDPRLIRIGQVLLIPESASGGRTQTTRSTTVTPPKRSETPIRRESTPLQSLDTLQVEESSLPSLDDLDPANEFDEEDLDEQPMIQIQD